MHLQLVPVVLTQATWTPPIPEVNAMTPRSAHFAKSSRSATSGRSLEDKLGMKFWVCPCLLAILIQCTSICVITILTILRNEYNIRIFAKSQHTQAAVFEHLSPWRTLASVSSFHVLMPDPQKQRPLYSERWELGELASICIHGLWFFLCFQILCFMRLWLTQEGHWSPVKIIPTSWAVEWDTEKDTTSVFWSKTHALQVDYRHTCHTASSHFLVKNSGDVASFETGASSVNLLEPRHSSQNRFGVCSTPPQWHNERKERNRAGLEALKESPTNMMQQ